MSRTMTTAIERIADEPRFAERFRRDPERALRRYRLTTNQVAAIKAGDPVSLRANGVDVVAFSDGKRHGLRRHWRRALVALSTVGVAMSMASAPAAADEPAIRLRGVRRASTLQLEMGRAINVKGRLLDISSIRTALRRQGLSDTAGGRFALRDFLGIRCLKVCEFDIGDGEPLLLSD